MKIEVYPYFLENSLRNIIYILKVARKVLYCIDPTESRSLLGFINSHESLQKLPIVQILITHYDFDHVQGIPGIVVQYPNLNCIGPEMNANIATSLKLEYLVNEGDKITSSGSEAGLLVDNNTTSNLVFQIYQTPGHVSEHVIFYCFDLHAIFCGDLLTYGGVGNCHSQSGNVEDLYKSVDRINQTFDDTVRLFCAHDYILKNLQFGLKLYPQNINIQQYYEQLKSSTEQEKRNFLANYNLSIDRKVNLFLMLDDQQLRKNLRMEKASNFEVFRKLRQLRDHY